jgi:hypothetical protein
MSDSDFSAPFRSLLDYLDGKDFNYSSYPEENRVTLTMSGKNANYRFTARISHEGEYLQITANYPFFVREEKLRPSTAELITRANYNMLLGKFEMDMKDGEVRFHVSHAIEGTTLSTEVVERHFMTAFFTIDRYFPALMQHLHAGYTPEDAVFHAELDTHAERVEDTPMPTDQSKGQPTPSKETKPRSKKISRKKPSDRRKGPQGDLPL